MIEVHHLNNSRSQRILWLLEELGLDYDIVPYQRDPVTRFAPPAIKAVHPLGKSPVIRDGGLVVAESGAIVEYLVGRYGNGRLAPPADFNSPDYVSYLQWLHFAEGSAMLPLLLKLYVGRLKEAGAPLAPRIESELKNHFDYMSGALGDRDYFVANTFSAADIQLSFVLDAGGSRGPLKDYPNLVRLHERLARPSRLQARHRARRPLRGRALGSHAAESGMAAPQPLESCTADAGSGPISRRQAPRPGARSRRSRRRWSKAAGRRGRTASAACAPVPCCDPRASERRLGARLLRRILGVGRDGDLAAVPLARGEMAGSENADAHHAHVLGRAAMQQAVEVGRVPAGACARHRGRIEQIVVDLHGIEAAAVDHLMQRRADRPGRSGRSSRTGPVRAACP